MTTLDGSPLKLIANSFFFFFNATDVNQLFSQADSIFWLIFYPVDVSSDLAELTRLVLFPSKFIFFPLTLTCFRLKKFSLGLGFNSYPNILVV